MRIIVGGVLSLSPFGPGTAWHHLHYADGFRRLGHDVYYVEQVQPRWCTDADGQPCAYARSANREHFASVMAHFGFSGRASQLYDRGQEGDGLPLEKLLELASGADLLVNISGHIMLEPILERAHSPTRRTSGVTRQAASTPAPVTSPKPSRVSSSVWKAARWAPAESGPSGSQRTLASWSVREAPKPISRR